MSVFESTPNEVIDIVNILKSSNSVGYDQIFPKLIKNVISEISTPLSNIINLSWNTGKVPDQLKIAKIIPIYKSNDKELVSNFRPISILPFFSKILEKIMYNRLLHYLETNKIITDNQFGFHKTHSTCMALLKLMDEISNELDNKNHSVGIISFRYYRSRIIMPKIRILWHSWNCS